MVIPIQSLEKKFDKYTAHIEELLANEQRNFAEIGMVYSQKREMIRLLSGTIEKMMYMNYSIKSQVHILSENIPMFSMTIETYKTHLSMILDPSILRMHRINTILAKKIQKIQKARAMFNGDTLKEYNFLVLKDVETGYDTTITHEDYLLFLDLYEKSVEAIKACKRTVTKLNIEKRENDSTTYIRPVYEEVTKYDLVAPKEEAEAKMSKKRTANKGTYDVPLIEERKKEESREEIISSNEAVKTVEADAAVIIDTNKDTAVNEAALVETQESRIVESEFGNYEAVGFNANGSEIGLSQEDVRNIKTRVTVEFDRSNIPGDLNELIEYNDNRTDLEEHFSYFNEMGVFQISNYLPADGELVIINNIEFQGKSTVGAFRYHAETKTLYFIRKFLSHIGFSRLFGDWERKHHSSKLFLASNEIMKMRIEE